MASTGAVFWGHAILIAALCLTAPMMLLLAGVRTASGSQRHSCETTWRWRSIAIVHSHHPADVAFARRELTIAGRHFCAGCYGLLIGTLASDIMVVLYLRSDLSACTLTILGWLIPAMLGPIVARYTVHRMMRAWWRLLSNALLALACMIALLVVDARIGSALANAGVCVGWLFVAHLRYRAAISERSARWPGTITVRT